MEPERKIEKWLRAFAKKRRADARDAFQLHPATRRMLQSEVARQVQKPEEEPESLSLWDVLRERWAVLLGFALIIFFGATLFLPALSKAKNKSTQAETASKLKQIGVAAQMAAVDNSGKLPATLDELTNQLASRQVLTDSVSGKPFVYVGGGADVSGLQSTNVLAFSPNEKNRAVLFADGSVRQVRQDEFLALTNGAFPVMALAENAQARRALEQPNSPAVITIAPAAAPKTVMPEHRAPAAAPPVSVAGIVNTTALAANAPTTEALAQNGIKFKSESVADQVQFGLNNSQRYRQTTDKKLPPVLNTFEVQQNGSQIAVVDQDGSVYNGSLQPAGATLEDLSKAKGAIAKPGASDLLKKDLGVANNQSAVQNYFFRVSGANRSLKQNVVFTGNIIADDTANLAQNAPSQKNQAVQNVSNSFAGQSNGAAANGGQQAPSQSLFSNARIMGTATIDQTNQVEINALPVTP